MLNSQNRSKGKPGIVQPKSRATKASVSNANEEQRGNQRATSKNDNQGGLSRSSSQGREGASGSHPND